MIKWIPRRTFTVIKRSKESPNKTCKESKSTERKKIQRPIIHEVKRPSVQESEKCRPLKENSVFYSVLVVMWRQCDVAFLSTFILLLFLRIYQNLSTNFLTLFLLNITTQGVRHHTPLTTSLSLLFVRWTREGLLARRSVHTLYG